MRCFILFLIGSTFIVSSVISGCGKNLPPEKPVIFGRNRAYVGDTVLIHLYSIDPEDNVITYLIDWGDTTKPQWSYFFQSGDTIERTHIYYQTGLYFIRAKAKDIDRKESDWSDTFRLVIEPKN
ncbi:MAG: hypothetical protein ABIK42_02045 [candidate division WOR-3 bacterium]